jgi:hypothetical protein
MSEGGQYKIGSHVSCSDGDCGELTRVVIDPVARALTHLVVAPEHDGVRGRLVPVELVESNGAEIRLHATLSEFDALDPAVETELLPPGDPAAWGYGAGQVLALPYFGLGMGPMGMGMGMGTPGMGGPPGPTVVFHDRIPVGEVEVRRGAHVAATDGDIGAVRGLVVDASDHHVTHFLLEEGHLWGRKVVAIPIGSVAEVAEKVRLTLTKKEIGELPPVELTNDD